MSGGVGAIATASPAATVSPTAGSGSGSSGSDAGRDVVASSALGLVAVLTAFGLLA